MKEVEVYPFDASECSVEGSGSGQLVRYLLLIRGTHPFEVQVRSSSRFNQLKRECAARRHTRPLIVTSMHHMHNRQYSDYKSRERNEMIQCAKCKQCVCKKMEQMLLGVRSQKRFHAASLGGGLLLGVVAP